MSENTLSQGLVSEGRFHATTHRPIFQGEGAPEVAG
jgi:hypothetical protein